MHFFVDQLINGLTLGSVYALIALGYSLVYGVLKMLNFAHGAVYMVGAFIGYFVLVGLGGPDGLVVPVVIALLAMFAAAALGSGLLGVAIERFAYRPLRGAPRIAPLITALGIAFVIRNGVLLLFGAHVRNYSASDFIPFTTGIHIGPLDVWLVRVLVIVAAAAMMLALTRLVSRTKLGKSMRAVSYDPEAAEMMGIDIDRTIAGTFFIGSALAGIAGVMAGLVFGQVFYLMGFIAGLKGFAAAVVGGIGNVPGAMLGGLLIGMAEAFATGYISSTFQDVIAFALLIAVLLVRPNGLLGRAEIKKV